MNTPLKEAMWKVARAAAKKSRGAGSMGKKDSFILSSIVYKTLGIGDKTVLKELLSNYQSDQF